MAARSKKKIDGRSKTSAANGKLGGRKGANAFIEPFEDLEPPPREPLERGRWMMDLLAADMYRMTQIPRRTTEDKELSRDLRATATAMQRIVPIDTLFEALEKLKAENEVLKEDQGPAETSSRDLTAAVE